MTSSISGDYKMKTDMSSKAVTRRLRQTSKLRNLCLALGGERLQKRLRKKIFQQTQQNHKISE